MVNYSTGQYFGRQLPGVITGEAIFWGAFIRGAIILRGTCPGGNCPRGNYPGAIIRRAIVLFLSRDIENSRTRKTFVISFYEKLHESTVSWFQKTNGKPILKTTFRNIIRNCYWDPFLVKPWALPEAIIWRCLITKGAHNNFTGKRRCRGLFFDKAEGWRPETLLKRDFSTDHFMCIFWNA